MRRVAALLAALALAGCSEGETPRTVETYVALGDSYTSGAGMPETVAGSCARSGLAYPRLVADDLGAELVDASCGGASTEDATRPQLRPGGTSVPAQIDSLAADTDLVTVGFGYNDLDLLGELLAGGDARELPELIGPSVAQVVADVRAAAPDAEVLVVGYPRLAPADSTCADLALDADLAREVLAALDEALRDAAEAGGATYVDAYAASAGHDVCAGDDAWVSGAGGSADQRAPYHPRPAGHAAVAELVVEALGR